MVLSVGTDGQDGPTDAAGAFVDVNTIRESGFTLEDAQQFLEDNDSYNFFDQAAGGKYHIKTGNSIWNKYWVYLSVKWSFILYTPNPTHGLGTY